MHIPEQPAHIPKPAPPLPRPYTPELSRLERVFDFRDPHFHDYMTSISTEHESVGSLTRAGEAMAEHEHPGALGCGVGVR